MKKIILGISILVLSLINTGCSNTKVLEETINVLQVENQKLKDQLKVYKDKEEQVEQVELKTEEDKSGYKEVKKNEMVLVEGYGEFMIKSIKLAQEVSPPNTIPDVFYIGYSVDNPNEIYLDVVMDFKNTTNVGVGADEVTNVKVIYDDKYVYDSFMTLEELGGSNFTETKISIEPLQSMTLHYLATLPIEVKNDNKPIKIRFSVYESNYELKIR